MTLVSCSHRERFHQLSATVVALAADLALAVGTLAGELSEHSRWRLGEVSGARCLRVGWSLQDKLIVASLYFMLHERLLHHRDDLVLICGVWALVAAHVPHLILLGANEAFVDRGATRLKHHAWVLLSARHARRVVRTALASEMLLCLRLVDEGTLQVHHVLLVVNLVRTTAVLLCTLMYTCEVNLGHEEAAGLLFRSILHSEEVLCKALGLAGGRRKETLLALSGLLGERQAGMTRLLSMHSSLVTTGGIAEGQAQAAVSAQCGSRPGRSLLPRRQPLLLLANVEPLYPEIVDAVRQ